MRFTKDLKMMLDTVLDGTGIHYEIQQTSRHTKVHLHYNDRSRYVIVAASPSDHRAILNQKQDVKRIVRELKQL